jgi:hypothetical protein
MVNLILRWDAVKTNVLIQAALMQSALTIFLLRQQKIVIPRTTRPHVKKKPVIRDNNILRNKHEKYFKTRYGCYAVFLWMLISPEGFSELPGDLEAGKQIHQEILAWLDSIQSLQCTMKLRMESPSGVWKESEVEFRWQDSMLFYQATTLACGGVDRPVPAGSLVTESFVDGKGTLLGYQNGRMTGEVNREDIHFSQYSDLIRKLLEKIPESKILETFPTSLGLHTILTAPGTASFLERNGERVLMFWSKGELLQGTGVNVFLNEQNRIDTIEFVSRPICPCEEAERFASKEIYDVMSLLSRVELLEYQSFNGIWFPCYIRETVYPVTDESLECFGPLRLRAYHGEISFCEYHVKRLEDLEYEPIPGISEIQIKSETVQLNAELDEDDFLIEIPPGTPLVNMQNHEVFRKQQQTWRERHADLLIILAALSILAIATLAGWRYWYGKP